MITHAGIAAGMGRAFSRVCLYVRALTGKQLELSTPNLVHVYSTAVARHALTQKSKGQGHTVASDHRLYSVHLCTYTPLCYQLQSICVPSLVLIAQTVFLLECGQTDRQTRLNALPTPATKPPWVTTGINHTIQLLC